MLSVPVSTEEIVPNNTIYLVWSLVTVHHSLLVIKSSTISTSKLFLEIWFHFTLGIHTGCLFQKPHVDLMLSFPLEKNGRETD